MRVSNGVKSLPLYPCVFLSSPVTFALLFSRMERLRKSSSSTFFLCFFLSLPLLLFFFFFITSISAFSFVLSNRSSSFSFLHSLLLSFLYLSYPHGRKLLFFLLSLLLFFQVDTSDRGIQAIPLPSSVSKRTPHMSPSLNSLSSSPSSFSSSHLSSSSSYPLSVFSSSSCSSSSYPLSVFSSSSSGFPSYLRREVSIPGLQRSPAFLRWLSPSCRGDLRNLFSSSSLSVGSSRLSRQLPRSSFAPPCSSTTQGKRKIQQHKRTPVSSSSSFSSSSSSFSSSSFSSSSSLSSSSYHGRHSESSSQSSSIFFLRDLHTQPLLSLSQPPSFSSTHQNSLLLPSLFTPPFFSSSSSSFHSSFSSSSSFFFIPTSKIDLKTHNNLYHRSTASSSPSPSSSSLFSSSSSSCSGEDKSRSLRSPSEKSTRNVSHATPLPYAKFKEAHLWTESLISSHLASSHLNRSLRNRPPRAPPATTWDVLEDGRVLKRMIEGGEGDLYPSPQTNVTIEFSMHTLSGLKLLDHTSFNTTMMEFPFSNAMPGMQIALASMRKLERSVFLLSPEVSLPPDLSIDLLPPEYLHALSPQGEKEGKHRRLGHIQEKIYPPPPSPSSSSSIARREISRESSQEEESSSHHLVTVKGGDWIAFDITLCNIYDRDKPWWRIAPGMPFIQNLPTEEIPHNVTHDEWLEQKADQVRDKIHDEMATNPASRYWEDIEPAMNDYQREKVDNHTARLYGLDKPQDPRHDGSRGFRDYIFSKSGGMRHGCDMGDRMTGKSKNYVWRETVFGFEVVLFIKEGIRSHHVSWSITSKRLDLFFVNHKVFGDEFQHSIDHEEAAWTLTEAATRYPPMTSDEVDRLYHSSPLSVPLRLDLPSTPAKQPGESDAAALTAPSSSSSPLLFSQEEKREEGQRKTRRQQKGEGENLHSPFLSSFPAPTPIGQLPDESTSYTCEALLSSFKAGELDSLRLPLQQPALHILLPKSPNWREMWGSPFKFV